MMIAHLDLDAFYAACELLDHPRLVSQLCGLERRTARSGKDSIDHAPGGHDDVANAAAGALVGVLASSPAFVVTAEMLAQVRAAPPYRGRSPRLSAAESPR